MYRFKWSSDNRSGNMEIFEFLNEVNDQVNRKIYINNRAVKKELIEIIMYSLKNIELKDSIFDDVKINHFFMNGSRLRFDFCYIHNRPAFEFEYICTNDLAFTNNIDSLINCDATYREKNEYYIDTPYRTF